MIPKRCEEYFYIGDALTNIQSQSYYGSMFDKEMVLIKNCFETREKAEKMRQKLLKVLANNKDES